MRAWILVSVIILSKRINPTIIVTDIEFFAIGFIVGLGLILDVSEVIHKTRKRKRY